MISDHPVPASAPVVAPALEVVDAHKAFEGRHALAGCSFTVPTGCVSAFVGLNGSGKTILLRAAAGAIALDAGTIQVAGELARFAAPPLLSYLPQGKPLPTSLLVRELIGYASALSAGRLDTVAAFDWLDEEMIPLEQRVGALSGGQRTQVALAVAVSLGTAVLALDEPMADLDPLARERLAERLVDLAAQGRTVIVSSHAVTELASWCNHLIVINAGRTLETRPIGTTDAASLEGHVLELLRSAQARGRSASRS